MGPMWVLFLEFTQILDKEICSCLFNVFTKPLESQDWSSRLQTRAYNSFQRLGGIINFVYFQTRFFFLIYILFLAVLGLRCYAQAFSSCGVQASHCGSFSCCIARALGTRASVVVAHGLSSCGLWALECSLSSCGSRASLLPGMWNLPGPGLEPVSPALAGRFLTTAPPGKSSKLDFILLVDWAISCMSKQSSFHWAFSLIPSQSLPHLHAQAPLWRAHSLESYGSWFTSWLYFFLVVLPLANSLSVWSFFHTLSPPLWLKCSCVSSPAGPGSSDQQCPKWSRA